MTQQINLLNLELRKKRDLLTAKPLAIAVGLVLVLLMTVSTLVGQQAAALQSEADKRAAELKASQDRLLEMGKSMSDLKPNPELLDELSNSRAMLNLREEVIGALEGKDLHGNQGFAEFLRGFARQVPNGLWLSGFNLHTAGEEMEIRGNMLNSTALPEYIRRLNSEKAFQGRSFSSLVIQRPGVGGDGKPAGAAPGAEAASAPPAFVEFVLRSKPADASRAAAGGVSSAKAAGSLEVNQ